MKVDFTRSTPALKEFASSISSRRFSFAFFKRKAATSRRTKRLPPFQVKWLIAFSFNLHSLQLLNIPFEPFDDLPFALQAIDAERVIVSGENVQLVSFAKRLQLVG